MSRIRDAVALTAAKIAATLMQLVAVRTYVHVLGMDAYGVYVYFTTVMAYVVLVDVGIISSFQREVLDCKATDRSAEVPAIARLTAKAVLAAALIGIPVYVLVAALLPFPFHEVHPAGLWLFAFVGWLHLFGNLSFLTLTSLLAGAGEFRKLSVATGVSGVLLPSAGMASVLLFRTPESIVSALAVSFIASSALALALGRSLIWRTDAVPIDGRAAFKRMFAVGIRGYLARLAATFAGSLDRLILANVQHGLLAAYGLCLQISQTFQELLLPLYQMMFPRITKAVVNAEPDRAKTFENYVLAGAAMGSAFALVGAGYAQSITRVWIGKEIPDVAITTIWLGVSKCSDLTANIIGITHFAHGRMDRLLPNFTANAALTGALTAFVLIHFGMAGVATMNALITLGLLLPLLYTVRINIMPELRVFPLLLKVIVLIGCGAAFAALAAFGGTFMKSTWQHLFWCLSAPLLIGLCLALEIKVFHVPMPHEIAAKAPALARILKPVRLGPERTIGA